MEDGKPCLGDNFRITVRDLETRMREAASNLEFEEAARLRDELKRMKLLDLQFANDQIGDGGKCRRSRRRCRRGRLRR